MFQRALARLKLIRIPLWVKIVLSLLMLWLVFRQIDWYEAQEVLKLLPMWMIGLITLSTLVTIAVNSVRWTLLIPLKLTKPVLMQLTAASYLGTFYSLFLPSSLGGDVVKWGLSFGNNVPKARLASSIVMDRVIGLIAASMLSMGALLYIQFVEREVVPILIAQAVLVMFCGVCGFVALWLLALRFPAWLEKTPVPKKLLATIALFDAPVGTIAKALGLSLGAQIAGAFVTYLTLSAVNANLQFSELVMIAQLTAIVASLPITFGGFGSTEISVLYLSQLLGANQQALLSIMALGIPLRFINAGIAGIVGWVLREKYLSRAE
jgi:uncharacterized membrane protein YbhN (UPF0104 family)